MKLKPSLAPRPTAPPRHVRVFVAAFLAVIVACPLVGINAWPFSSWRLFSNVATNTQSRWEAVAVDASSVEHPYAIAVAPNGYRGFGTVMAQFSHRPTARRNALCEGWMRGAATEFGGTARLVRIYRLQWRLSERRGKRAAPPSRDLAWTCSPKGADAAS